MSKTYRLFDHQKEDTTALFALYEATYGDASPYARRWNWEINQNPSKRDIKIFIAEHENQIVGATTRFPFQLRSNDRIIDCAFSGNSMVHPDFRRQGIMEQLYEKASEVIPLLYSKGTMPGMYKLLMKMGYTPVYPNTYMTCILSFPRWFLWRTNKYHPEVNIDNLPLDTMAGFHKIDQFDGSMDDFWKNAALSFPHIIQKDKDYLNWRYFQIPHRHYKVLCRRQGSKISSVTVINGSGTTAKIVDILWNRDNPAEPAQTIKNIKKACKCCGYLKILCWGTHKDLRNALKKNGFWDRGETSRFSVFSKQEPVANYTNSLNFHFVEADGDAEYL
ncbi:MAG: GNAT family N-acetyltransferase [Thermodesulfobacteriota bacterium]|nr:GNAT family N-acetyltransferase [Thermodesulfobacteriota bacterium]